MPPLNGASMAVQDEARMKIPLISTQVEATGEESPGSGEEVSQTISEMTLNTAVQLISPKLCDQLHLQTELRGYPR